MTPSKDPCRPSESDMISRPRLYARAASLAGLAAENGRLRDNLSVANQRIANQNVEIAELRQQLEHSQARNRTDASNTDA